MARIAGVDLKPKLGIAYALTDIYGIGLATAKKLCTSAGLDPLTVTSKVDDSNIALLKDALEKDYQVEGDLRQKIFRDIKRLKDIRCYRGDRHKKNLPVRGQKTRGNCRSRKGKSVAVGGLKRVLAKT